VGWDDPSGLDPNSNFWYDKEKRWADRTFADNPYDILNINGSIRTVLDLPANTGHLGEGLGTFAGDPTWCNVGGALKDIGTAFTWITAGAGAGTLLKNGLTNAVTNKLKNITEDATANASLTAPQAQAALSNPNLANAFMGNQIDALFKAGVSDDWMLGFLKVTPRFTKGPDVCSPLLNTWWDVTTGGQWEGHVARYSQEFGQGIPIFWK
jgi:hypothetical protein